MTCAPWLGLVCDSCHCAGPSPCSPLPIANEYLFMVQAYGVQIRQNMQSLGAQVLQQAIRGAYSNTNSTGRDQLVWSNWSNCLPVRAGVVALMWAVTHEERVSRRISPGKKWMNVEDHSQQDKRTSKRKREPHSNTRYWYRADTSKKCWIDIRGQECRDPIWFSIRNRCSLKNLKMLVASARHTVNRRVMWIVLMLAVWKYSNTVWKKMQICSAIYGRLVLIFLNSEHSKIYTYCISSDFYSL